jgi:hypothetical protein
MRAPHEWTKHVPKVWGSPHLASQHVASFIEFIVDFNVVYDDLMMKLFAYSLKGKSAW